ncbi:MAG: hypothetical protein LBR08_05830, partial [Bacteroidales bacterium]|nr:hypothetical protein [Bacteroidales bacterium]
FTSMQGCAPPRQGLPFDNPVQAKRSAGYENSKLNRMQYIRNPAAFGSADSRISRSIIAAVTGVGF